MTSWSGCGSRRSGSPIPPLCVEPTDDGWIVVRDAPVGRLVVRLDEAEPLAEDACAQL